MNKDSEKNKQMNMKVLLVLFLLAGGLISSVLQYDVVWDFMNYHYYNAWAFLNNRVGKDIAVAGINAFFNPLPDLPLYFLIKYFNNYPALIYFIQGLWFGALWFVFYKIASMFLETETVAGKIRMAICLIVAITGNALFLQIGASSNEVMIAFLVMLSLYLLLDEIFDKKSGNRLPFVLAGFILGSAMGLKLTAFIYCVVTGLCLIVFYKQLKFPLRNILLFTLAGLVGFLIFNAFWMVKMWNLFANPFFPFANAIFKSEWLSTHNFADSNYIPKNFFEFMTWPVILSLSLHRAEGKDMFISDMRPLIVYLIFIWWAVKYLCSIFKHKKPEFNAKWAFLIVFFLMSYFLWMIVFSISRYYVVIEMLSAIFIVKALFSLKPKSILGEGLYYSFALIIFFVLVSTSYFSEKWGHRYINWKELGLPHDGYFVVEKVNIPDNILILTYNYPTAAFLAYWGQKVPFKAVNAMQAAFIAEMPSGEKIDYFNYHWKWAQAKNEFVQKYDGPIFVLVSKEMKKNTGSFDLSKDKLIKDMYCKKLANNHLPFVELCVPKGLEKIVFEELPKQNIK